MRSSLFAILLTLMSFAAYAKDVTVALEAETYPPYYYVEEGELTGFSVEVLELITEKLGFQIEYKKYPWLRINQFLREGKVDMSVLYLKTPERQAFVRYSNTPYIYERYFFYSTTDNHINITSDFEAIKDLRIGTVRGYSYGDKFDQFTFPNKVEAGSEEQLIDMLNKGRVDLIIGDKTVIDYHINRNNLQRDIRPYSEAVAVAPAYFVFSKAAAHSTLMSAKFSDELDQLLNSSEYTELLKKYNLEAAYIRQ